MDLMDVLVALVVLGGLYAFVLLQKRAAYTRTDRHKPGRNGRA